MNTLPVMWSFRRCPYAMRARMGLLAAGQQVRLREIILRDKPDEMVAASPKATVPVLVAGDGAVIDESLNIMLWALEQNDPENLLNPELGSKDEMLALVEHCETEFKPHLDRYKYATRYDGVDPLDERRKALEFIDKLETRLIETSCLFGRRPALADIAVFPFVRQFAAVERDWFNSLDLPNVHRWLEARLQSELFKSVMNKYPLWRETGEEFIFGGDLRSKSEDRLAS